jgi:glutamine amidotransferase
VGEASSAMNYLKSKNLDKLIINLHQPVLGVCLGMQLLCSHSDESNTKCLGIFPQTVRKFTPGREQFLKVPQIGWNNIYDLKSAIFMGVPENSYCYFVHGYYAGLSDYTISVTDYVQPYSSGLHKGNFYGVQFHPEKSAEIGERIYQNFLQI